MAPSAIVSDTTPPSQITEVNMENGNETICNIFSLSGQTVVVTGGGRGLGITLAIAAIEAGACVACLDILPEPSPEEWFQLQKLSNKLRLSATYHLCDVTDEDAVAKTLQSIASNADTAAKPFKGIVACAGVQQASMEAIDYPVEDFNRILNVNVMGTFLTAKHASRIFIEMGIQGSIVLVASMSGQIANRGLNCTAYNSSKSAVQQMCRSMAQEIGVHGIRINTLSPGHIRTAMTDALLAADPKVEQTWMRGALLGRLGVAEDFKAPTIFLLASGSSFMTGADLRVDGGHCASA